MLKLLAVERERRMTTNEEVTSQLLNLDRQIAVKERSRAESAALVDRLRSELDKQKTELEELGVYSAAEARAESERLQQEIQAKTTELIRILRENQ